MFPNPNQVFFVPIPNQGVIIAPWQEDIENGTKMWSHSIADYTWFGRNALWQQLGFVRMQ